MWTAWAICLSPIPITVESGKWTPPLGLFKPWPGMEPSDSAATGDPQPPPNLIFLLVFLMESQATAKVTYLLRMRVTAASAKYPAWWRWLALLSDRLRLA